MCPIAFPFGLPVVGSAIAVSLVGTVGFTATLIYGDGIGGSTVGRIAWFLALLLFLLLAFLGVGLVLLGAPGAVAS